MANYSADAIIRAVCIGSLDSQLVENVYHLKAKNAGIPDNEIAATVRDKIVTQLQPNFCDELVFTAVTVQEIFPTPRDPYELAINIAGGQAGDPLPSFNAGVCALKTGLGGRRNRGRKYYAGLLNDDITASRIITSRLGALQIDMDAINSWFAAGNGLSNLTWGIVHRQLNGAPVPLAANSYVPITSAVFRDVVGTMRSRKIGHGS